MFVRTIVAVCIITFGVLYFLNITSLTSTGGSILDLNNELATLERENREMQLVLGKSLSLANIEARAVDEGLVNDDYFVYVAIPSSLVVSKK